MLFSEANVVDHIPLQVVSDHLAHTIPMEVSAVLVAITHYPPTSLNPTILTTQIDSGDKL